MLHKAEFHQACDALCTALRQSACWNWRLQSSSGRNMQGNCSTLSLAALPCAGGDNFLECAEDLGPRRSVDVRMADAATLPMAAFGAAGIETSSAVIRGLMASHDHWREPGRPAQAPR